MKKKILISFFIIGAHYLFSQPLNFIEKLPICESVYFQKNTSPQSNNSLSFFSYSDNKHLYKIENVNIWKCLADENKSIFLVREKGERYKIDNSFYENGNLYLLNFREGKKIYIDNDILDFALSNDGNRILYIKNQNINNSNFIYVFLWENNNYFEKKIDLSQFINTTAFYTVQIKYHRNFFEIRFYEDGINSIRVIMDDINSSIKVLYAKYDNGEFYYQYSENEKENIN